MGLNLMRKLLLISLGYLLSACGNCSNTAFKPSANNKFPNGNDQGQLNHSIYEGPGSKLAPFNATITQIESNA